MAARNGNEWSREGQGEKAMNLTIGIVMLVIGIGMILLGRPRRGEDFRPFLGSTSMFVAYPGITLVFLAMGFLTIVMNL
jgi:hypothetical protein